MVGCEVAGVFSNVDVEWPDPECEVECRIDGGLVDVRGTVVEFEG